MKNFFRKKEVQYYTIAFIIFSIVLMMPFLMHKMTLVHKGDAYEQYFPVFVYIGRYLQDILHGNFYLFDFSIGYGEDIIGTMNYYGFGDPLNLFSVFVTEKNAEFLFAFLIFVRLYLAGIGMIAFLNYHHFEGIIVSGGGIIYVFSFFAIWQGLWFYTFLNAMYLLPFLLIQLEKLSCGDKARRSGVIFAILIGVQGCCGFYFLYFQTVFIAIYWLVMCDYTESFFKILKQIKNLIFYYITGIFLSAVFLFPAIYAFVNSSRMVQSNEEWRLIFEVDKLKIIFGNLFIPMLGTGNESLGIPVICALAIVCCFSKKYVNRKELFMTIFLLTMYISPAFWRISNGFSYATDRWIYIIYFWLSYITVKVLTKCREKTIEMKKIALYCIVVISSLIVHYMLYMDKIRSFFYLIWTIAIIFVLLKKRVP